MFAIRICYLITALIEIETLYLCSKYLIFVLFRYAIFCYCLHFLTTDSPAGWSCDDGCDIGRELSDWEDSEFDFKAFNDYIK